MLFSFGWSADLCVSVLLSDPLMPQLQKFNDDLWKAVSSAFDRPPNDVLNEAVQYSLHRIVKKEYSLILDAVANRLGLVCDATHSHLSFTQPISHNNLVQLPSDLVVKNLDAIVSSLFSSFDEKEFTDSMIFMHDLTMLDVKDLISSGRWSSLPFNKYLIPACSTKKMIFPLIWELGDTAQTEDEVVKVKTNLWGCKEKLNLTCPPPQTENYDCVGVLAR